MSLIEANGPFLVQKIMYTNAYNIENDIRKRYGQYHVVETEKCVRIVLIQVRRNETVCYQPNTS